MSAGDSFTETVFGIGSVDQAHLTGDFVRYDEGDHEPYLHIMFDVGDETLSMQFDAYHLRELRLALTRAERWVKANQSTKGTP